MSSLLGFVRAHVTDEPYYNLEEMRTKLNQMGLDEKLARQKEEERDYALDSLVGLGRNTEKGIDTLREENELVPQGEKELTKKSPD